MSFLVVRNYSVNHALERTPLRSPSAFPTVSQNQVYERRNRLWDSLEQTESEEGHIEGHEVAGRLDC